MNRISFIDKIAQGFEVHPIVAILGPRQCGKTTLARQYQKQLEEQAVQVTLFDLENPRHITQLAEPQFMLEQCQGLVILDEIQLMPNLFPLLRVLVDRENNPVKFLILGSASRDLLRQSSESLAGRIEYIELTPFSLSDDTDMKTLLVRGGFPLSYLAKNDMASSQWREAYIRTYLEQDLPNLGIRIPPLQLRRFWMMLSHYHGNIWNASDIGRSLQMSYKTTQEYLDILTGTFMIRRLTPWFENIGKRQVKAPKIYFRDTGLLLHLLGINHYSALLEHPKLGAIWEGFALEEIIRFFEAREQDAFYWATHSHAELDLLLFHQGKRIGFEFEFSDTPKITKSMHIAIDDLKLDHLFIIYPGSETYHAKEKIHVISLNTCFSDITSLIGEKLK